MSGFSHESNSPDFPFHGSESAADFDAELIEELCADGSIIGAVGDADGVEHGQSAAGRSGVLDTHGGESGFESAVMEQMASEASFEAFFESETECFVQGVVHVDGGGVVIGAVGSPVIAEQPNIEVPAGDFAGTAIDCFESAWTEGDGSESWRAAEAFLGAAVGGIDTEAIDFDGNTAE